MGRARHVWPRGHPRRLQGPGVERRLERHAGVPDPARPAGRHDRRGVPRQLSLARAVGARTKELYDNLAALRATKTQATELGVRTREAGHGDDVADAAAALSEKLTAIEGNLTQLEGESTQDALNFPGRLDNQFVVLYGFVIRGDRLPPRPSYDRFGDLNPQLDALLEELNGVVGSDLETFNDLVRSKGEPPVAINRP